MGRAEATGTHRRDSPVKYRLEGTIIEALDTYVRITLGNGLVRVTKRERPTLFEVLVMLQEMQGYSPCQTQRHAWQVNL